MPAVSGRGGGEACLPAACLPAACLPQCMHAAAAAACTQKVMLPRLSLPSTSTAPPYLSQPARPPARPPTCHWIFARQGSDGGQVCVGGHDHHEAPHDLHDMHDMHAEVVQRRARGVDSGSGKRRLCSCLHSLPKQPLPKQPLPKQWLPKLPLQGCSAAHSAGSGSQPQSSPRPPPEPCP